MSTESRKGCGCGSLILAFLAFGALVAFTTKSQLPPVAPQDLAKSTPKQKTEHELLQEEIGAPPVNEFGKLDSGIQDSLARGLRDPGSLQIIDVAGPKVGKYKGNKGWICIVTFRGKNGFGGYAAASEVGYFCNRKTGEWFKDFSKISQ